MVLNLPAQTLTEMQKQLETIEEEMSNLEKQIRSKDNRLKVALNSQENVDKQISLTHNKILIYQKSISSQRKLISRLEKQIDSLQLRIRALKDIFRQQVVFAYKYQRGKQFDWLLGADSFNEIFVRYTYFRKVLSAEKSVYGDLDLARTSLESKEKRLTREISTTQELLNAAKKEESNLSRRRKAQAQLIKNIKKDRSLLSKSLQEKKASYEKLRKIIASLEKGRPARQLKAETQIKWEKLSGSFSKNKGKINWPVAGSILHGFGRFRNPELKTVLNNTGIDIKANLGQDVRCIFSGIVSLITYMSGFGNMVIVDHNDGYYSVYAHLDQIHVNPNQFVEDGEVLGKVGESGSLEGAKLHFEIYGKNKNLNPMDWLKKK
jgi:septal ring factor EnvC (AmiA/AmiB activator)